MRHNNLTEDSYSCSTGTGEPEVGTNSRNVEKDIVNNANTKADLSDYITLVSLNAMMQISLLLGRRTAVVHVHST